MSEDTKPLIARRLSGDSIAKVTRIDEKKFVVEFTIDDLIKDLLIDPISPIAACNGCNSCSMATESVVRGG